MGRLNATMKGYLWLPLYPSVFCHVRTQHSLPLESTLRRCHVTHHQMPMPGPWTSHLQNFDKINFSSVHTQSQEFCYSSTKWAEMLCLVFYIIVDFVFILDILNQIFYFHPCLTVESQKFYCLSLETSSSISFCHDPCYFRCIFSNKKGHIPQQKSFRRPTELSNSVWI